MWGFVTLAALAVLLFVYRRHVRGVVASEEMRRAAERERESAAIKSAQLALGRRARARVLRGWLRGSSPDRE